MIYNVCFRIIVSFSGCNANGEPDGVIRDRWPWQIRTKYDKDVDDLADWQIVPSSLAEVLDWCCVLQKAPHAMTDATRPFDVVYSSGIESGHDEGRLSSKTVVCIRMQGFLGHKTNLGPTGNWDGYDLIEFIMGFCNDMLMSLSLQRRRQMHVRVADRAFDWRTIFQ